MTSGVQVLPGDESKHDVPGQRITGCCRICSEVDCDDDCRMRPMRQAGDAQEFRQVVINRATGDVFLLERGTGRPFDRPITTLDLVVP